MLSEFFFYSQVTGEIEHLAFLLAVCVALSGRFLCLFSFEFV